MHVCKENVGYVFKVVRDTFLKIPPHSVSMWEYWWHRSRKETDTDTTLESSPSSEYPSVTFVLPHFLFLSLFTFFASSISGIFFFCNVEFSQFPFQLFHCYH